jgi:hypothetical protein
MFGGWAALGAGCGGISARALCIEASDPIAEAPAKDERTAVQLCSLALIGSHSPRVEFIPGPRREEPSRHR